MEPHYEEAESLLSQSDSNKSRGPKLRKSSRVRTRSTLYQHFLKNKILDKSEESFLSKYESLDYDQIESPAFLEDQRRLVEGVPASWALSPLVRITIFRWILALIIGVLTAIVAFSIDCGIRSISSFKYTILSNLVFDEIGNPSLVFSYLLWLVIDIALVSIAGFLVVFGEPIAAGSGIPEVKCYLNGIKMPHIVRIKTLLAKGVGVMCSVAGGLSVGKEGPMIHSGAVIAAGISQGKATSFSWIDLPGFRYFRNDTEKRDFVSMGAAAGVAAAFGAPIGGVLFSLEEGASFWNQNLTWRSFFCAMASSFTLNVLLSLQDEGEGGVLSNPGLVNFGTFQQTPYLYYELPLFMCIGALGGLFGALFNFLNLQLTKFRMKYITTPFSRIIEVIVVTAVSTTVAFALIFYSDDCLPVGVDIEKPIQFFCPERTYSAMGTLLFNTPELAIKSLFHNRLDEYSPLTLTVFFVSYFCLAVWTYGVQVPSGLFVPCILIGASWGRLIGAIFLLIFPDEAWVEPGKYALIGAAAMLGGVVRMTISLTVIIIEATGNITYGLPIMVTVMVSKWVGDIFNEGLYDIHIELKHVPILHWDPPASAAYKFEARDVMSTNIICLEEIAQVCHIISVLKHTTNNAFPVVTSRELGQASGTGRIKGIILRHQLVMLLRHKAFGPRISDSTVLGDPIALEDLRRPYPRWPTINTVHTSTSENELYMNLKYYMNPHPYTLHETASLHKVFRMFRTMGLRHLCITDTENQVTGMVTRKDLVRFNHAREDGTPETVENLVKYTKHVDPIEH
eukprot:UC4_evm1s823